MLELPDDLRGAFKEPLGPVFTDPAALLAADGAGRPLIAVGDVVTAHLVEAGRPPDVAVIDGKTERHAVADEVARSLPAPDVEVTNPPATLSEELLEALVAALDDGPTVVGVDGEEDLATLPALLAAPLGGAVVYGQPGEGMVLVPVTEESRATARDLLSRMAGEVDAALAILGDSADSGAS
ncbi:GTP-dependent dephospho-CoA kinase family protein [Haloplanus halophilus]|uniref:GTP-dependent dephospho-CoA kinase family protein n=1 Tax=Haloplanus halophilus TaxID=2949993 RepID=UPI002040283B|nr:GTP-dependent dephospho-CoA kinase family protein [Haloplanus sp. GDY1]